MDLDDIRLFARVAELKSFVAAANEMQIQTSLLSRRVARLEASLGVRLLQRTTRRVSLTEEGQRFLSETSLGLGQLQSAVETLHSLHGAPRGRIRVASQIEIGQYLVGNVMSGFYSKYPEIDVEWDLLSADKNLLENGIDVAIRGMRSTEQSAIEKKIGELSFRMYRSSKLDLAFKKKPTIEAIENLPWIVFSRSALDHQKPKFKIELDGVEHEIRPKKVRFRTNSLISVRHAIVQGIGVGLLPSPISDPEVLGGRILPVSPNSIRGANVEFYAVYPSREYLAPKVRVLIDWLAKHFPTDSMKA